MMLEKLNLNKIYGVLRDAKLQACAVTYLDSVDSTNEWSMKRAREGEVAPFACFAEQQTQGRGRHGKKWISPPGGNIYMSLVWSFDEPVSQLQLLSLAMGLAVIKTLEKAGIHQAMLKWPNDVLVDDKKIAGILIETAKNSAEKTTAIIGVGLNYQLPTSANEFPEQPWTDVVTLSGEQAVMQRSDLAGGLLQESISMCKRLPLENEQLIDEFCRYDVCNNEQVSVLSGDGRQWQGVACGINAKGELRVLIDNKERVFNSAEISLGRKKQMSSNKKQDYGKAESC